MRWFFPPHQTLPVICLHCIQQQHRGKITIQQAIFVTDYLQRVELNCAGTVLAHMPLPRAPPLR